MDEMKSKQQRSKDRMNERSQGMFGSGKPSGDARSPDREQDVVTVSLNDAHQNTFTPQKA